MRTRTIVAAIVTAACLARACALAARADCSIELSTRIANAFPGTWNGKLRIKTTLELQGERVAVLALFDEDGNRVSYAEWEPHERTRWTEWRDLGLGSGEYLAVFATEHCRANDKLVIN